MKYNTLEKKFTSLKGKIAPYAVRGHLRRLFQRPDGTFFNASEKQLERATEFGIKVPDNYTFVAPYSTGEHDVTYR